MNGAGVALAAGHIGAALLPDPLRPGHRLPGYCGGAGLDPHQEESRGGGRHPTPAQATR
jgi:hypothetical protein